MGPFREAGSPFWGLSGRLEPISGPIRGGGLEAHGPKTGPNIPKTGPKSLKTGQNQAQIAPKQAKIAKKQAQIGAFTEFSLTEGQTFSTLTQVEPEN